MDESFFECYEKARQSLASGRLQLALAYLQRAIDLNSDFFDAYHLLGEVLRRLGRTEEAAEVIGQLDQALEFDPQVKLACARVECDRGRYGRAERLLRKVLKHPAACAEANYLLGEIHRAQGRYAKAESYYGRCLEQDASHSGARRGINEMLRNPLQPVGESAEEESLWKPSTPAAAAPALEETLSRVAELIEQGRLDTARATLQELARKHPGNEVVILALARVLQQRGDLDAALGELQKHLATGPASAIVLYCCGQLLNQTNRFSDARRLLEEALRLDPDYYEAVFELGATCHRSGDRQGAEQAYRRALELMPDDVRPKVNLAHLRLQTERSDEAETLLLEVLKVEPTCQQALLVLGTLYDGQKRHKEAVQCYEALIRMAPYQFSAHVRLALALERQGRLPEALEAWKRVARMRPDDPEVQENLLRLETLRTDETGEDRERIFT